MKHALFGWLRAFRGQFSIIDSHAGEEGEDNDDDEREETGFLPKETFTYPISQTNRRPGRRFILILISTVPVISLSLNLFLGLLLKQQWDSKADLDRACSLYTSQSGNVKQTGFARSSLILLTPR
jgi:hypothetical protein